MIRRTCLPQRNSLYGMVLAIASKRNKQKDGEIPVKEGKVKKIPIGLSLGPRPVTS